MEFQKNFQSTCTIQLELRAFSCIAFTKLSVSKVSQIRAGAKLNTLAFVPSINFVFKEQAQLGLNSLFADYQKASSFLRFSIGMEMEHRYKMG